MLPDQVAFPCLAAIYLDKPVMSDSMLIDAFIASLGDYDVRSVEAALQSTSFDDHLQSNLITILSSHGCRSSPTPSNFRNLLLQCARYIFLTKKQHCPSCDRVLHIMFWNKMSVDKLFLLYKALQASTDKVINVLEEPEFINAAEEEVWLYLRSFIGNLNHGLLRAFLRFVTGSVLLCTSKIYVTFNSLSGLSRRPIGHTCSNTIELPTTYSSLPEFNAVFSTLLTHG